MGPPFLLHFLPPSISESPLAVPPHLLLQRPPPQPVGSGGTRLPASALPGFSEQHLAADPGLWPARHLFAMFESVVLFLLGGII